MGGDLQHLHPGLDDIERVEHTRGDGICEAAGEPSQAQISHRK